MKQALDAAGSLEALAKKLNLKVETPDAFPKSGPVPGLGAPKAVLDAVFAAKAGRDEGPDRGRRARRRRLPRRERHAVRRGGVREGEGRPEGAAAGPEGLERLLQALIQRQRSDLKVEFNKELLSRMAGART